MIRIPRLKAAGMFKRLRILGNYFPPYNNLIDAYVAS